MDDAIHTHHQSTNVFLVANVTARSTLSLEIKTDSFNPLGSEQGSNGRSDKTRGASDKNPLIHIYLRQIA